MPIKCIEEYNSKPELLMLTALALVMVNLITSNLDLEPLVTPTLWYRLIYEKAFEIFIMPKIKHRDLVRACLCTK